MFKLTSVFLLSLISSAATAADGTEFVEWCSVPTRVEYATYNGACIGLVKSAANTHDYYSNVLGNERLCVPDEVTSTQLVKIGLQYFEENPEYLEERARQHLLIAWQQAFICTEQAATASM